MLNETEYSMVMFGRDSPHKSFKEYLFECYENGDSIKTIAKVINKSKTTVYRYLQVFQDKIRYPVLKAEIRIALHYGNFESFVENLSYKDICLIRRHFGLYGSNKASKTKAIIEHFKIFSVLGLYPEGLTKHDIKIAFRNKAKQTHPDLNKNTDKFGKEFQAIHQAYKFLIRIYA